MTLKVTRLAPITLYQNIMLPVSMTRADVGIMISRSRPMVISVVRTTDTRTGLSVYLVAKRRRRALRVDSTPDASPYFMFSSSKNAMGWRTLLGILTKGQRKPRMREARPPISMKWLDWRTLLHLAISTRQKPLMQATA